MGERDLSDREIEFSQCKTIGPRNLNKYLGEIVGKLYFFGSETFCQGRAGSFDNVDIRAFLEHTANGDFALTGCELGATKDVIKHGDAIRLYSKNNYRDRIFIDGSD